MSSDKNTGLLMDIDLAEIGTVQLDDRKVDDGCQLT